MTNHVYKSLELTASSATRSDHAIRVAIANASESVRDIRWFEVLDTRGHVEGGKIKHYAEVFDRSLALAQLDFAPERLKKIATRYASRLKETPAMARHAIGAMMVTGAAIVCDRPKIRPKALRPKYSPKIETETGVKVPQPSPNRAP